MQKPASLRKALTAALEELRKEPTRLAIWIEDGAVRSRDTGDLSFGFEYPLSVLLRDMKTDIALVTLAITRWLRVNQPDLLAGGPGDSFKFETDILDNEKADILITLQLREAVKVTPIDGPNWRSMAAVSISNIRPSPTRCSKAMPVSKEPTHRSCSRSKPSSPTDGGRIR